MIFGFDYFFFIVWVRNAHMCFLLLFVCCIIAVLTQMALDWEDRLCVSNTFCKSPFFISPSLTSEQVPSPRPIMNSPQSIIAEESEEGTPPPLPPKQASAPRRPPPPTADAYQQRRVTAATSTPPVIHGPRTQVWTRAPRLVCCLFYMHGVCIHAEIHRHQRQPSVM